MLNPSQKHMQVAAKSKLNDLCQEINQQMYKIMAEEIQKIGPDQFLETTYGFCADPKAESTHGDSTDSGDKIDAACSGVHVKISRAFKATDFNSTGSSVPPRLAYYRSASEAYSSSDDSFSSQSTSPFSLIQGNTAPLAPMTSNLGFLSAATTPSWNVASPAQLPVPRPAPQLKRSHSQAISKIHRGKRHNGKYDPENHEIMRLRQEENLDFQEIADKLNEVRHKNGGKDDLTDNAIYSRYTRNAPLIAQMRNEKFMPTAKDNQYTKMKFPKVEPISGFGPREDALLKLAEEQIQEQFWTMVSKRIEELGGGFHDPEMCERRFDCL